MPFLKKRTVLFIGVATLLFVALIGVVSYQRLGTTTPAQGYCNDYACTNFRNGDNWSIRNCQGTSTEGSTFTCTQQGQTGSCGSKTFCCPGAGMLWTTDMTQCNQSPSTSTSECCACPTPTPYMITSACNGPCMSNGNCSGGNVCLFDQGYGWVCRNPACYTNTGCSCASVTPTPSSTPTPTRVQSDNACRASCNTSDDCSSDLRCMYVNNTRQCRNPSCSLNDTCNCSQ